MHPSDDCHLNFKLLTDHSPFPWQQALYRAFLKKTFPKACDIPTGLGKTSIIAVWLLALAEHARAGTAAGFARRLVYVVNRRTVVDQATREAESIRDALVSKQELREVADALRSLGIQPSRLPLAISTLRGQLADNAEWRDDPARPAVIVGTVDMVGSRLLFSGYGCGFKSRPLHAGLLGQDTLLVHDEAHLEPAFQELAAAIAVEQLRCREFRRFDLIALTATSRNSGERFRLTAADRKHVEVRKRLAAKKGIAFHQVDDEKETADQVARRALKYKDSGQAILLFLRKLEHVEKAASKLRDAGLSVQTLTGTLRGLERDALARRDPIFARFVPQPKKPEVAPRDGTVYMICTSAGEVGIDMSADHMICDLTPFDSMAQRFGRVNRFGLGNARIDVLHCTAETPTTAQGTGPSPFDQACARTLSLLRRLPKGPDRRHDASPAALDALPVTDRQAAFAPSPVVLPASDILFDTWALTSIRQKLPGRPPVADWLHGVAEWEPPETHVAWREEVECLTGDLLDRYKPEELLADYPIKPHELLRDRTKRVFDHVESMAKRCPQQSVWVIDPDGRVSVLSLAELVETDRQKKLGVPLADCTLLLPPAAGGLENGMLSGGTALDPTHRETYDVADQWLDRDDATRRCRAWDDDETPDGMRQVRMIDTRPDTDDEPEEDGDTPTRRYWYWYVRPGSADDDGSRTAREPQELGPHLESAESFANAIVAKLGLGELEASAVTLAARWHDLGKRRAIWQRSIGNHDPQRLLAKSGGKMRCRDLSGYRHEFGSLLDVTSEPEFRQITPVMQNLVLHLIATHHGRARPHFPADEAFDPGHKDDTAIALASEVPRRFAGLQRKYGRWGLAYLESLVRAADALASQAGASPEGKSNRPAATPSRRTAQ